MVDDEKRMELTEHLAELRSRILRSLLYLTVGSIGCFVFFEKLFHLLLVPLIKGAKAAGVEWVIFVDKFTSPFFTVLQLSVVAGLIVTSPLLTSEAWGFIAPALTREEKKPLKWLVPFSIVLFLAGVALAYWAAPFAIQWFCGYIKVLGGNRLNQDPQHFVIFMVKLMAAFGVVFQLPIVLMFLAWVGILTADGMKKSWRHAVVGISVVGLFVTPSNDPFTMLMMIIPVIILYMGSIGLVRIVERNRTKRMGSV